jgi:hypothetical protein
VEDYSSAMHRIPAKHVVAAEFLYEKFDYPLLQVSQSEPLSTQEHAGRLGAGECRVVGNN